MNWLIIQSNGEHKENVDFRECYAYEAALKSLGHQTLVWGLRHKNFEDTPKFGDFDVILCLENYDNKWVPDYSNARGLKLFSIIDLHMNANYNSYPKITRQSDIILHATRSLMSGFGRNFRDKRHIWFPNAVDSRFYNGIGLTTKKTNGAVFIGSVLSQRQHFIDKVASNIPLIQKFIIGHGMVDMIAAAKVSFNRNVNNDINYRTFETIGIGTCLATDSNPDLIALGFKDGVNCLLYKSAEEAAEKIRLSLASGSWDRIARAGFELSRSHTYERRLQELGQLLKIRI